MSVRVSWLTAVLVPLALAACATSAPAQEREQTAVPAPPLPISTAFTLTTGTPRTPEQMSVTFDRADLAIRVMPETQTIEGVATLDFTATAPLDRLVLELDTLFFVSAVSLNGRPAELPSYANIDGRLTIPLHDAMATGDRMSVRIAYTGRPHVAENAPWDGGFVWATTPDGRPWVATAIQGEGCDLFWPCIDHPQGGPARVDMHITVPTGLSAPGNGRFVGRQDHGDGWTTWNWTARDVDPYGVSLNVGPFAELSGTYESRFGNRIPLHYWHLASDDPAKAQSLFAEFSSQLEFYERTIGPFPFGDEKMGVVETPHLGMEHQTINAYGNGYKLDGKGYDWLLQHELAHEWFGNQMTNVTWDDMWLHEGLGTYMQPLYARYLHGDQAMQADLARMRLTLANRFPLVSGRPLASHQVYDGEVGPGLDIYYKGALVAHTLRLLIGDEAFYESLRRLVYGRPDPAPGNFTPRHTTTTELVEIVSRTAGQDMGWFFDAYVYQASLPDLRMTRQGDRLELNWITARGTPFPMPVEVEVDEVTTTLPMAHGSGSLTVPAGAHVLIDPRNRVLRRLEHVEAFQAWQSEEAERAAQAPAAE